MEWSLTVEMGLQSARGRGAVLSVRNSEEGGLLLFYKSPFHTITDHADQLTTSRLRWDRTPVSLHSVYLSGEGNVSLGRASGYARNARCSTVFSGSILVKMFFTPTPRQHVQAFRSTAQFQWPTAHCGHKSTSSRSC